MSNKNTQSSIFSFFPQLNQPSDTKKDDTPKKTVEKRTHKDLVKNNPEEYKKLEKELAPLNKTFPPKSKNGKESEKLEKNMEQNINSLIEDNSKVKKPKKKLVKKKVITDSDRDSDFRK